VNLLALDTSSEGCSAALLRRADSGSGDQLTYRSDIAPRGHTRLLMPMIRDLLREATLTPSDLDALAFACGPGSFTGLRIATGVVQGLAYGLDIPVVPVSSLEAVAAGAIEHFALQQGDRIVVAFDARMGEVYWASYESIDGRPQALTEERVCPPDQIALEAGTGRWFGAGSGWRLQAQFPPEVVRVISVVDDQLLPRADRVAELAVRTFEESGGVTAARAQPVYIRDEVAWKKLPGR
jgi:tRNA threonylcarbamoyladenosine biosynthesis protein TsaB